MGMGDVEGSRFAATGKRRRDALPVVRAPGPHPHPFLPTCRADLEARGWDAVDIVIPILIGDLSLHHSSIR